MGVSSIAGERAYSRQSMPVKAAFFLSFSEWCWRTGLNCRPLHYQWSALPLSYASRWEMRDHEILADPRIQALSATRLEYSQADQTCLTGSSGVTDRHMVEHPTKGQKTGKARRAERLAKELRENLKRRKAQARGRAEGSAIAANGKDGKSDTDSSAQP